MAKTCIVVLAIMGHETPRAGERRETSQRPWQQQARETAKAHLPVGVGGAVGRAERAVWPAEAGVALAPRPPVLAGDAVQERLPVARAAGGGHRLGLPGRPQRPAQPAAAAIGEEPGRREEVVREEQRVEQQRGAEEGE
jgi:hypothetical protein